MKKQWLFLVWKTYLNSGYIELFSGIESKIIWVLLQLNFWISLFLDLDPGQSHQLNVDWFPGVEPALASFRPCADDRHRRTQRCSQTRADSARTRGRCPWPSIRPDWQRRRRHRPFPSSSKSKFLTVSEKHIQIFLLGNTKDMFSF